MNKHLIKIGIVIGLISSPVSLHGMNHLINAAKRGSIKSRHMVAVVGVIAGVAVMRDLMQKYCPLHKPVKPQVQSQLDKAVAEKMAKEAHAGRIK